MTPGLPRLRIAFHSIILRSGWRITFVAVPLLALLFLPRALLAQPDPSLVSLFENSGVVMLLIEPESGAIIRANSSAARFYGHSQQELQSMAIQDINTFTPEQVKKERLRAARENRNFFIFRHRLSDGRVKRVEVYSHPIVYRGRQVLFSIIHDVSDERFMQETVEHYNRQLEGQVDERTEELRTYQYFLIALAILQFLVIAALVYTRARRKKAERALEKLNQELEKRIRIAVESIREKESIIHEREKRRARDDLLIDLAHQWRQPLNAAALEVQNIGDLLEGAPGAAKIEELKKNGAHLTFRRAAAARRGIGRPPRNVQGAVLPPHLRHRLVQSVVERRHRRASLVLPASRLPPAATAPLPRREQHHRLLQRHLKPLLHRPFSGAGPRRPHVGPRLP